MYDMKEQKMLALNVQLNKKYCYETQVNNTHRIIHSMLILDFLLGYSSSHFEANSSSDSDFIKMTANIEDNQKL